MNNPCLSCGACCAYYRVSFYWAEPVPAEYTVTVTRHRIAMRGTEKHPLRCEALRGEIGDCVNCSIYEDRPSVCRELMPSWHDGERNEQCDKARAAWDLPPLESTRPTVPPLLPEDDLPRVA